MIRPSAEMAAGDPPDEPRPVLRPARPWGCIAALLVWLAFWAVVITLVIRVVTPR